MVGTYPHGSIPTTRGKDINGWMDIHGIDSTEMTVVMSYHFVVLQVPTFHLKLIHSFLHLQRLTPTIILEKKLFLHDQSKSQLSGIISNNIMVMAMYTRKENQTVDWFWHLQWKICPDEHDQLLLQKINTSYREIKHHFIISILFIYSTYLLVLSTGE